MSGHYINLSVVQYKARVNHDPIPFEVDELTYEEECSIADWQYYDKFLRDNFNENEF